MLFPDTSKVHIVDAQKIQDEQMNEDANRDLTVVTI